MKKSMAITCAALAMAAVPGFSPAQGDGGSQTPCELQYSTCKQTAHADYQFCVQASEQNCKQNLDMALQRCSEAQYRCNQATGDY